MPDAPLTRVGLVRALIDSGGDSIRAEATGHLEIAARQHAEDASTWRFLSVACGHADRLGMSALASAEHAFLVNHHRDAVNFAQRARKPLPFDSPSQLRVEDIEHAAQNALRKQKN